MGESKKQLGQGKRVVPEGVVRQDVVLLGVVFQEVAVQGEAYGEEVYQVEEYLGVVS